MAKNSKSTRPARRRPKPAARSMTPPAETENAVDLTDPFPASSTGAVPEYPKPAKAYKNLDFLNSPAGRLIRIQCELTEPAGRFRKHHVHNTIVLFGSARIPHPKDAAAELKRIEKQVGGDKSISREQKSKLEQARRLNRAARYHEDAMRLSHDLTKWSMEKIPEQNKRFYICSGGGPGIMEAANRGAREAGGKSVALGISLPFEQHLNEYATEELGFEFHYFFVRKYWFLYLAKALVVFPGGFGTMDELFELLTLVQTRKTRKYVPIILYGKEFWKEVINFRALVEWGVISEEDLDLFRICDSVEETRDYLINELTSCYL